MCVCVLISADVGIFYLHTKQKNVGMKDSKQMKVTKEIE